MRVNISLNDFRRKFDNIFPGFILRVRDGKNDIAYYNGNKAFEVQDEGNNISLSFPINTYKCNTSDVIANINNKENYINSLIDICSKMNDYYEFSMSSIPFKKTGRFSESKTKDRLLKFGEHISQYGIKIDVDKIIQELNNIDYENKKQKNKTVYIRFGKTIKDIKQIINIQYHFIHDLKVEKNEINTDTVRGISFSSFKAKKKSNKMYETGELDLFNAAIKNAINSYKGKDALEKKYQHLFMLHGNKDTNVFKPKENCIIIPFEQEYNLKNKIRNKEGRIDCVFYQFDKINKKITDIYLIELKVNEDVVAGNNGVLTHLDDIQSIINNKKYFLNMINFIEYRMQKLIYDDTFILKNSKSNIDFKIHFYTIFGFTKTNKQDTIDHTKEVLNLLKMFETTEGVNSLTNSNKLDSFFENKCIYDIAIPKKNKYIIKFLFDTLWVRDGSTEFKLECTDKTSKIYINRKGYFDE